MKRKLFIMMALAAAAVFIAGCHRSGQGGAPSSPAESPAEPSIGEPSVPAPAPADVTVDGILAAIRDAYGEEYPPDGEIPPEILGDEFGLTPGLCEEARGEMTMMSAQNDRVVVAKAAPGRADELEEALLDARRRKIEDTLQYPMNIPKTNAAQVVRQGDYVAFLLVGAPLEDIDASEQERIDHAEREVQKGVDAFNGVFRA